MAKFINETNYKKVEFGSEGYLDLSEFTEISSETGKKGEIGITLSKGSKRVKLNKSLFLALGEPECVKVSMSATQIAIKTVPVGTNGAYDICKGAVIYSSALADKIIKIASSVDFQEDATTRCGKIEVVQTEEDGATTAILNFD